MKLHASIVVALFALAATTALAQGPPDIQWTSGGHSERVDGLAFASDGATLVSGAGYGYADTTVKVWRVADRRLLRTIADHISPVRAVAISPDGATVASAGNDLVILLHRIDNGALLRTITGCSGSVLSLAFSADGATLVSGDSSGYIRYWRTADGAAVGGYGRSDGYPSVSISPDGSTLASGWSNGSVRLFRMSDGALLATLTGHTGRVVAPSFSADGALLATGSYDSRVMIWRMSDWELLRTISGHSQRVNSVSLAPDGQSVASGSSDATVRLSSVADGTLICAMPQDGGTRVRSVAFSPDGTVIAVGGENCSVTLRSVPDGALAAEFTQHRSPVRCAAISPAGSTVASGSGTGTNVVGLRDCTVRLWRTADGALLHSLVGHTSPVTSVTFSPDGSIAASAGSDDRTVRLWQIADGASLITLTHPTGANAVAFSPDGLALASGCGDSTVKLWRVSDGALLNSFAGHTGSVNSLAFSANGATLVSGSDDGTARVWRVSDGTTLCTLSEHTEPLLSVDFAPDGARVLTSSRDGTIRVWRAADGQHERTITWYGTSVCMAAFSADGEYVVAGSSEGVMSIWRLFDGALMWTYDEETGRGIGSVAVSRDGLYVAYARFDGTLVLARMPASDMRPNTAASAPDRTGVVHSIVTLKAYLWRMTDRQFLAGREIGFAVDGTSVGAAFTDVGGKAELGWPVPTGTGARPFGAVFAGDSEYRGATASATLTVAGVPTHLYVPDRTGNVTDNVTLKGWLRRSDTAAFLQDKTLTYSVDGTAVASGATGPDGRAAVVWRIAGWVTAGSHVLGCAFDGDDEFAPSTKNATLVATQTATKMAIPDRSGSAYRIGNRAYLTAYLYRANNTPIDAKTVQFSVDGTVVGSAVTKGPEVGGNGRAMFLWDIPASLSAGTYAMRAAFLGDNGYTSSRADASVTIEVGTLYIWPYVHSILQGDPWPLRAYVRTVPDYVWQPGLTIEYILDPGPDQTTLGSAATNSAGIAALTVSTAGIPVGTHVVRERFAGNASLAPAYADRTISVVAP